MAVSSDLKISYLYTCDGKYLLLTECAGRRAYGPKKSSTTAPFNHCVVLSPSQKQRRRTFIGLLQTRKTTHIDIFSGISSLDMSFSVKIYFVWLVTVVLLVVVCEKIGETFGGPSGKIPPAN